MKTFIFLAILLVFGAIAYGAPQSNGNRPLPHFSLWERIVLKTILKSRPGLFKGVLVDEIFHCEPTPSAFPEYLYVDALFVDLRQLLTQSIKISREANLPELDWSETYDFCLGDDDCYEFTLSQRSANSRMIGTQGIESSTEVSPTSFKNSFYVPYFKFTSPNWQFNYTEDIYVQSAQGFHIEVENLTFEIFSDYEYVDGIGIQLRNLFIEFDIFGFIAQLDVSRYIVDGEVVEVLGPFVMEFQEDLKGGWNYFKEKFENHLLMQTNCLLSNAMSDPGACFPDEDKNYNAYYHFLILQLMQTIGMGTVVDLRGLGLGSQEVKTIQYMRNCKIGLPLSTSLVAGTVGVAGLGALLA